MIKSKRNISEAMEIKIIVFVNHKITKSRGDVKVEIHSIEIDDANAELPPVNILAHLGKGVLLKIQEELKIYFESNE